MTMRLRLAPVMGSALQLLLLQGCAAILGSKSTNVAAISQPPGAEVYLDGARVGVTPDTISVESKRSHTMVLKRPGYLEGSCALISSVDGGWVILDVLLGGLVGVIVDAASSEWNELTRKSCNLVLSPSDANVAVVAPEAGRNPVAAERPATQSFLSSAPNEVVSDVVKAERRRVVSDLLRIDLVRSVEQGPLGILRVEVGTSFSSHQGREYYFTQLASAYYTWIVEGHPLIVELWDAGHKIGEFTEQTFLIGPGHNISLDCPEDATTGICGSLHQPTEEQLLPAPSQTGRAVAPARHGDATASQAPPTPGMTPSSNARDRFGFHFDMGLGGGAVDFTCDGCDFETLTGFSGFLSLAGAIGEKTLMGVESTGWTRDESGNTAQVYSFMAHLTEYLSETSGLFVRAGLGLVGYRENSSPGDLTAKAFGFSGRLGYELGAGGVTAVPYVGYLRTFGGAELKLDGNELGFDFVINNFQFGLGIAAY